MTTKTIGTASRDYATITLWLAYLQGIGAPSADEIGELYNDSEFAEEVVFSSLPTPTGGAKYILRPATGQAMMDSTANPATYDQTKGVAWKDASGYFPVPCSQTSAVPFLFERLQIKSGRVTVDGAGAANTDVHRCLLQCPSPLPSNASTNADAVFRNCIFVWTTDGSGNPNQGHIASVFDSAQAYACTFARYSDKTAGTGNNGVVKQYSGTGTNIKNSIFANLSACWPAAFTPTHSYNATDLSAFPQAEATGLTSIVLTDTFESPSSSSPDFRVKSGASVIGAGVADATNYPVDFYGTTRANPPTIGAIEGPAGGGSQPIIKRFGVFQAINRAASF